MMANPNDVKKLLEYHHSRQVPEKTIQEPEISAPENNAPETIDWNRVDPRLYSALSRLGYGAPQNEPNVPREQSPLGQNYAGRPRAFVENALKDPEYNAGFFPKAREKGGFFGDVLDKVVDPITAGLDALWQAYGRPTWGGPKAAAEISPEFKEKYYDPWMAAWDPTVSAEEWGKPESNLSYKLLYQLKDMIGPSIEEKGTFGRTAYDVFRGVLQPPTTVGLFDEARAAAKDAGVPFGELFKRGYESWEDMPSPYQMGSNLYDPLDLLAAGIGKVSKATGLTKAVSKIPAVGNILAPEARLLTRYTDEITEAGKALKTAEELGMKPVTKGISKLWKLTPESEALEKTYNAMDLFGDELEFARKRFDNADAMGEALDKAVDAADAAISPRASRRSLVSQQSLTLAEGWKGKGKEWAERFKAGIPKWEEANKLAQEAGQSVDEFLDAARKTEGPAKQLATELKNTPRSLEHLQYEMMVDLEEYMGTRAAELYGVENASRFNEFMNMLKSGQSLLFLSTNPLYALNNIMNNMATAIVHGVPGYIKPSNLWQRIGTPIRAKAGIGAADTGAELIGGLAEPAQKAIRQATGKMAKEAGLPTGGSKWTRAESAIKGAQETKAGKIITWPQQLAQAGERIQGEMATAAGTMKAWRKLWKEGALIPEIPNTAKMPLAARLSDYGLLDDFRSAIRSSMNPSEIVEALYKGGGNKAERVLDTLGDTISPTDVQLLKENFSGELQRLNKAANPREEAQKILSELKDRNSETYQNMLDRQLNLDQKRLRQNLYGGVVGIQNDIDDIWFDTYTARDRAYNSFFDTHRRMGTTAGDYDAMVARVEGYFDSTFEKTSSRTKQMIDALKRAGHDGVESWFVNLDEWKNKVDAARSAQKKLNPSSPTYMSEKARLWTDYFAWLDGEKLGAQRRYLEGIANVKNQEVRDAIEAILQDKAMATEAYRKVLEEGWQKANQADNWLDINRAHVEMQAKREQIYGAMMQSQKDLYSKLAEASKEVGDVVQETLEGLHDIVHPDMALDFSDITALNVESLNKTLPVIAEAMRTAPVGDYAKLDPDTMKMLQNYVESSVIPSMAEARVGSKKLGEYWRDQAMLNYSRRYGYNQYLGYIFPYEFWYTTSLGHWAKKFIQKPGLLATYARMRRALNETEEGLPSRLRGMVKFELPFLPDWAGDAFVDPLSIGLPLENFLYGPESYFEWGAERDTLEKRLAEAKEKGESEDVIREIEAQLAEAPERNFMDVMGIFTSPGLPLQLAELFANPQKDLSDLQMLSPGSRFIKNLSAVAGGGKGIDIEGWVRGRVNDLLGTNIRTQDEWETYRVERMLSNMAADGIISAEEANKAIIEHTGPAWEEAQKRAAYETGVKGLTPFGDSIYPTGEKRQRELSGQLGSIYAQKPEEGAAWASQEPAYGTDAYEAWKEREPESYKTWRERKSQWYDLHPEYNTRQMIFDLPGERYRNYLSGKIWDIIGENKNAKTLLDRMFGEDLDAFYDGNASTEQIARLANALGIQFPTMAEPEIGEPAVKGFEEGKPVFSQGTATDAQVETFANYLATIEQKFGRDIYDKQNEYYRIKESSSADAKLYLKQHPELDTYWTFARQFKADNPDIAKIAWPSTGTTSESTTSANMDLLQRVAQRLARRGYRRG